MKINLFSFTTNHNMQNTNILSCTFSIFVNIIVLSRLRLISWRCSSAFSAENSNAAYKTKIKKLPKTKLYKFHKSEREIESLKGNKICLCYELKDRYHKDFCKSFEDFFKILRLQVFFVYTLVFQRF